MSRLTPFFGVTLLLGLAACNNPPTSADITLEPELPVTTDDLSLVILADSVDENRNDIVTYSISWTLDGEAMAEFDDSETIPASATAKGQLWEVTVTPADDKIDGESSVAQVTVQNSLPTAQVSIEVTPDTTGDVVAVASGADTDQDTVNLTWSWTRDGEQTDIEGDTVPAGATAKGQVWEVTVVAFDDESEGAPATAQVTIGNVLPGAPEVQISPDLPLALADDLFCEITTPSLDIDGDVISYSFEWTVDGVDFPASGNTVSPGDTVLALNTVADQVWECTAVPWDDVDAGVGGSDSVTIIDWTGLRAFNTCAQTGYAGPDQAQCDAAYAGSTLASEVTVALGIQTWTVPSTGVYLIEAYGAQGAGADVDYDGGLGAYMSGDFALTAGQVLTFIVGQAGSGADSGSNGGGGGGSYVLESDGTPLLIAGGGGGTRDAVEQNGCDGWTLELGGKGSGSVETNDCATEAGTLGYGGAASSGSWGSGGAGLLGDGDPDASYGYGGTAAVSGAEGGQEGASGSGDTAHGGFGGGGSGRGSYGGGGGGGYTGGEGGRVAGGGGSYNVGSNPVNSSGANAGAGSITIDRL